MFHVIVFIYLFIIFSYSSKLFFGIALLQNLLIVIN